MTEQEQEAYELFRRAILQRDEGAWAEIHARYRPMLISWSLRYSVCANSVERADDIADHALARAWAALTPERFVEFPTLAKLFAYLRACVVTTLIDSLRAQAGNERIARRVGARQPATPERLILADLDRQSLWEAVIALATSRAERVALVETFAYNRPPRDIQGLYPQLFPTVSAVYSVKRNLFARLQRNRDIIQISKDFVSI